MDDKEKQRNVEILMAFVGGRSIFDIVEGWKLSMLDVESIIRAAFIVSVADGLRNAAKEEKQNG